MTNKYYTLSQRKELIYLYSKTIYNSKNEFKRREFLSLFIQNRFKHWNWQKLENEIINYYKNTGYNEQQAKEMITFNINEHEQ
jgi:hypothetical protein